MDKKNIVIIILIILLLGVIGVCSFLVVNKCYMVIIDEKENKTNCINEENIEVDEKIVEETTNDSLTIEEQIKNTLTDYLKNSDLNKAQDVKINNLIQEKMRCCANGSASIIERYVAEISYTCSNGEYGCIYEAQTSNNSNLKDENGYFNMVIYFNIDEQNNVKQSGSVITCPREC